MCAAVDQDEMMAFALNILVSSLAQQGFEIFAIDNEYILITREKLNENLFPKFNLVRKFIFIEILGNVA